MQSSFDYFSSTRNLDFCLRSDQTTGCKGDSHGRPRSSMQRTTDYGQRTSSTMTQSPSHPIKTVGIVGAGQMGHGIGQVMLRAGHRALLLDMSQDLVEAGAKRIAKGLARDVEKARMTAEERDQALTRLKATTLAAELASADFIIEAVTEKFEVKAGVFRALEPHYRPETILASNTSSISITRLAAATQRPDRFIGLHFFNPVAVMKLVEVVPGLQTSPETADKAVKLAESAGKTPVRVNDSPGFISNRLLMPMINEAVYCLMESVAD